MICDTTDKIAYPSERSAKQAVRALKAKNRDGYGYLHPYRCGGHWHIGHGRSNKQNRPGKKRR